MALQYITKDILTRTDGSALLDLPYDMSWVAGYDKEWVPEDFEVKTYGQSIMARAGEFIGEQLFCFQNPYGPNTGGETPNAYFDVEKNNLSIYSTKPSHGAGSGNIEGVLSTTTFISGDKITFKVTQVGTINPGQGLVFTLKCRV